ncbi:hypothetical protein TEA_023202 [Camellia sinensis var. sinensis]|uniref:Uncharacterized protein n=1 Tax=Camellia sinensis var. sinensis TaxID=542762 RepID=A0A4S4EYY6_CAMSN|nr:hypothetical protein TEA_023202 [Camellia sinensis var. sinensis]
MLMLLFAMSVTLILFAFKRPPPTTPSRNVGVVIHDEHDLNVIRACAIFVHSIAIKSLIFPSCSRVGDVSIGWQPGIPEISSVWDEDWDKFKDEGFSFDVAMPPKTKSTSAEKENYSPNGSLSPDLMSHADDNMSDKLFSKGERACESESAYTHSEDESGKSPSSSPARHTAFESPSREYSDNHFKKSPEADAETHRSFDEPSWGTFDNNDDVDSVWGFNPSNPKGSPVTLVSKAFGDVSISKHMS